MHSAGESPVPLKGFMRSSLKVKAASPAKKGFFEVVSVFFPLIF
jgi:hypothetical protein